MTLVVASLVERSVSGVSDSSKAAFSQGADLVEVRLDHLRSPRLDSETVRGVREAVRGPAVATLRSSEEGGRSRLRGRAREATLRAVLAAGFELVDLELERDGRLLGEFRKREGGPTLIASVHYPSPVETRVVQRALKRACKAGHIGKVAMTCEHAGQAISLASIGMRSSAEGECFVLIGMGEQGRLTRVCAGKMGSAMVYSSLKGKPAAPGQLDVGSQSALTREDSYLLGLVGHPVRHSVSAPMQEAALRRAGLLGSYLSLDLPPGTFTKDTLETLRRLGFRGLNFTVPHKRRAYELCDSLDSEAASTGAVNTITFERGCINGKNTDVIGFTKAIEQKTRISKKTSALILGAGGGARAAAFALARAGAHVTVAARDPRKRAAMGRELGVECVPIDSLIAAGRSFDIAVNCTPVGTEGVGGAAPLPPELFRKGMLFFDMVYNPSVTPTMRLASSRKARTANGLEMLVQQGAESFRHWTGVEPDISAMRSAARRALS